MSNLKAGGVCRSKHGTCLYKLNVFGQTEKREPVTTPPPGNYRGFP